MSYTIFDTPILNTVMRWISKIILKTLGWKVKGQPPNIPQYVMIAAPHTSNWDFVYMMLICLSLPVKIRAMGKKELFRRPFGSLFCWLGLISVDRSKSTNVVGQMVQAFGENKPLVLVIAPSGTRKKVTYWKTGFYHIANGAGVPIVFGYLDYKLKQGGIGPMIQPTGNMEEDMKLLRNFYKKIRAKYPEKALKMSAKLFPAP